MAGKQLVGFDLIINLDGSTNIENIKGAVGPACLKLTKPVEEALGSVVERTPTSDMNKKGPVVYDKTTVGRG